MGEQRNSVGILPRNAEIEIYRNALLTVGGAHRKLR